MGKDSEYARRLAIFKLVDLHFSESCTLSDNEYEFFKKIVDKLNENE